MDGKCPMDCRSSANFSSPIVEGFTLQPSKTPNRPGLPPGIIDISAPGYNTRAHLGAQAAKICRALQSTNQANFDKRFRINLLETYKIHNSIRKNIFSNFVSVELEPENRCNIIERFSLLVYHLTESVLKYGTALDTRPQPAPFNPCTNHVRYPSGAHGRVHRGPSKLGFSVFRLGFLAIEAS